MTTESINIEQLQKIAGKQTIKQPVEWLVGEYLLLKVAYLELQNSFFEKTYQMDFASFEKQCLSKPEHEWEEEQIIMEWDKTLALLTDYNKLLFQWKQENLKTN